MSFFSSFVGFLKKLVSFILIVAIAIPLRYGSTNRQYLQLRLLHSILSLKHSLIPDPARPTLSADYRAFENILRMKPIAEQDLLADPIIVVQMLRSTFAMRTVVPKPSQCQIHKEVFEHDGHSVDTYWVDYPTRKFQPKFDKLLIYLHGGGYILGNINSEFFYVFK
jgi:acetyl esterase/lipase